MRISSTLAFYLQASIVLFFLAGSSAPTPLYAVYQSAWGFSPITITVIFGIYALAVLSALLVAGSLSDYVGRRPVLLAATALQVVTMGIFVSAHSVSTLLFARIIQGLATGAAAGAVGAGMLDIDRHKGTIANAVTPMLGTGTGGLLSGLMVAFLPLPTQLVYIVLGGVFLLQAIGVYFMEETAPPRPGALASLRPHIAVPKAVRGPLLLAAPALIASWALAGFYGSLGPALVRGLAKSGSIALGGVVLFVLASSGAITVFLSRTRSPRTVLTYGAAALAIGVGITLLAMSQRSLPLLFVGSVVAGSGFGSGFQGAIRAVLPLAAPHERAGVLSILYVISYLAMGLPAILGGLRVVYGGGIFSTAREYGLTVMALATIALIGTIARRSTASAITEPQATERAIQAAEARL